MIAQQQQLDNDVDGRVTDICPHCESSQSLTLRQHKQPAYRCGNCKHEFDEPKQVPSCRGFPVWNLSRSNRFLLWVPKTASIDDLPELWDRYTEEIEGGDPR